MSLRKSSTRLFAILALFVALAAEPQQALAQDALTIFAAASMRNALDDVNAAFSKKTGVKVTASYAASSALAKQIAQGAPADAYISANVKWMTFLADKKMLAAGTRIELLGNSLVLIAPKDSKLSNVKIEKGFDIAKLAGDGRIAIADTKAVPAGLYAKAALTSLGVVARRRSRNLRRPKTCARRLPMSHVARRRSASSIRPTPRSSRR